MFEGVACFVSANGYKHHADFYPVEMSMASAVKTHTILVEPPSVEFWSDHDHKRNLVLSKTSGIPFPYKGKGCPMLDLPTRLAEIYRTLLKDLDRDQEDASRIYIATSGPVLKHFLEKRCQLSNVIDVERCLPSFKGLSKNWDSKVCMKSVHTKLHVPSEKRQQCSHLKATLYAQLMDRIQKGNRVSPKIRIPKQRLCINQLQMQKRQSEIPVRERIWEHISGNKKR